MPDHSPEDAVDSVLADAVRDDPELAARLVATYSAAALARLAPGRRDLPDADQLFAFVTGPPLPPEVVAERLGLDVDAVRELMEGDPEDEIEIDPTYLHGFNDTFGAPRPDGEEN